MLQIISEAGRAVALRLKRRLVDNEAPSAFPTLMRLESVSLILLLAAGSGAAYAWWIHRRRRGARLERDAVAGRATVTAVTREEGGTVRVAWRFRHPFTGASHDGAGALPQGTALPEVGEEVDIAYLADTPGVSCLASQLGRR